ncbi:MAG: hypothetical protein CMP20_03995 [Rickettsiales bacterium]|nr:hypothetical protein [Rickettsiales bacterium]
MATKEKEKEKKIFSDWEYKDRRYILLNNYEPLTYTLPTRHTSKYPCVWFDSEEGYNRELRYATNQRSVFVDEQKGPVTLKHIVFEKGFLQVNKENPTLQQFLQVHPQNGKKFTEYNPQVIAHNEVDQIEMEIEALNLARELPLDHLEAIMRVENGTSVSKMSNKELKRDALVFAKRNPRLFVDLATDDNVQLRNLGIIAVEQGILKLSGDNRTFSWASNNRKLFSVPFDEHPYSALAAWFKTDEGLEVFKSIEKKLK